MRANTGSYHFNINARFNTGIPMTAFNDTSWTLEGIAKHDNPNGNWSYLYGNNGYNFFVAGKTPGGDGHVLRTHFDTLWGGYSTDLGPGGGWEDGDWHHFAVTFDDDDDLIEAYFDYALVGAFPAPGRLQATVGDLILAGGRILPLSEFWDGYIDELRVSIGTALEPHQFLTYGVPEPTTLVLFGLALPALARRRRKRC